MSVTYGAGGSTREKTHEIVTGILRRTPDDRRWRTSPASATRAPSSRRSSTRYGDAGIENILALGGDPPPDLDLPPGELDHAVELVAPRPRRSATSRSASPRTRSRTRARRAARATAATPREKLAAADFAITQFFFDAEHYFDLVESLHDHGVDKPVIPGIMPATTIGSIKRMSQLQGSEFPRWLADKLEAVADDPDAVFAVGVEEATKLRAVADRRRRARPALLHAEPLDRDPPDLREPGAGRALARRRERACDARDEVGDEIRRGEER